MMIKIAICNDTRAQRETIRGMLLEFISEQREEAEILEFENGEDLIRDIGEGYQIVLLAHGMTEPSGLETARTIRKADNRVLIIFVSEQTECWEDGYDVQAFYYLTFPISRVKFKEILRGAFHHIAEEKRNIAVLTQNGITVLDVCEIVCFRKNGENSVTIQYYQDSDTVVYQQIRSALPDIDKFLQHEFLQPKDSCLVNPLHVRSVISKAHSKYLETSSGEIIMISDHLQGNVMKCLASHARKGLCGERIS